MWHFRHRYMSLHSRRHKWQVAFSNPFMLLAHLSCPSCPNKVTTLRLYQIPHLSWFSWKMNKLRWYPQQSQRFIFCKSFWSVLRSQALEPSPEPVEPDLAYPELRWTWLGFAPRLPGTFSGTFSGTLLNLTWLCTKVSQTFSGTFSGTLLNPT